MSPDKELREQIRRMTKEEVIQKANELGFPLTTKDFEKPRSDDTIMGDELENVAGGNVSGKCMGGGSSVSSDDFRCGYAGISNGGECDCVTIGNGAFLF